MWDEQPAGPAGAIAADADCAFGEAVVVCLRRISGWRVPPNWALFQWREEIEGHALAAACAAQAAYDPRRCVPFGAFVYRRVMARVLTRYRQEWGYARRCVCELGTEGGECPECVAPSPLDHRDLDEAVAALPPRATLAPRTALLARALRERGGRDSRPEPACGDRRKRMGMSLGSVRVTPAAGAPEGGIFYAGLRLPRRRLSRRDRSSWDRRRIRPCAVRRRPWSARPPRRRDFARRRR